MALLGTTQHRDVEVTIGGKNWGIADTHQPGEVSNGADTHYPGGSQAWRVMVSKAEVAEGTVEFTLDPDTDFWKLAALTAASALAQTIQIVDVYRSPSGRVMGSRKYQGVVSSGQDPDSDAGDAKAMMLPVKYIATALPTS